MKIISWNLNGIRACAKKGFFSWLEKSDADIILLQETRANIEQLPIEWLNPSGYRSFWFSAQKKGYSGVAIYTRLPIESKQVMYGLNIPDFDNEGRLISIHHKDLVIFSGYFPNSQAEGARLTYKLDFCNSLQKYFKDLQQQGLHPVIGADFNIAATPLDLENPKQNEKSPGYLPEERAWMNAFLQEGYVDTFRLFEKAGGHYTWWSQRQAARERNIGWRIDSHIVPQNLINRVKQAQIHAHIMGSDHCPVSLEIEV